MMHRTVTLHAKHARATNTPVCHGTNILSLSHHTSSVHRLEALLEKIYIITISIQCHRRRRYWTESIECTKHIVACKLKKRRHSLQTKMLGSVDYLIGQHERIMFQRCARRRGRDQALEAMHEHGKWCGEDDGANAMNARQQWMPHRAAPLCTAIRLYRYRIY